MKNLLPILIFGAVALVSPLLAQNPAHRSGMLFEDSTYRESTPVDPTRSSEGLASFLSLKKYCPAVRDQGSMPMCVAFSICNAMSIRLALSCEKQTGRLVKKTFSPSFVYNQIHEKPGCFIGAFLSKGLKLANTQGVSLESVFFTDTTDCGRSITPAAQENAQHYRITSFVSLFDPDAPGDKKLLEIKKSLSSELPVIVGMRVDKPFCELPLGGRWSPTGEKPAGHALVVIGYDDRTKTVELLNSFGTNWGNYGFITLDYTTFVKHLRYGWEISMGRFVDCD